METTKQNSDAALARHLLNSSTTNFKKRGIFELNIYVLCRMQYLFCINIYSDEINYILVVIIPLSNM